MAGSAVNRWQREQMRRWRDGDIDRQPAVLGGVGHLRRRRRPLNHQLGRHRDRDGRLVARPVVRVDHAAREHLGQADAVPARSRGGELPACRSCAPSGRARPRGGPRVLAGGSHRGDDALRPGAVPDQLELVAGEQPLADQHLVEAARTASHVVGERKVFARCRVECHQQHGARARRRQRPSRRAACR